MNRNLVLLVGTIALASIAQPSEAEARGRGRVWFGGGGGVRMGARGGVSVHWSSPPRAAWRPRTWSVGGSVYVGTYPRYRYYRPYYYYPTYVPSYYGESNYYPVAPAPAAAPGVVAVISDPRPPLPKLGVGLFAGGVSVQDQDDSSDIGLLGRVRLGNGGLLVEGELGKTSYTNDLRVDRRLGGALVYEIGARNRFAPYILAGLGVQQADVAGEFTTTQNFAELGIGIRYAVTPHFHITADVRAGSRDTMSADEMPAPDGTVKRTIAPPSPTADDDNENYTRGRLSAVLYF
ncbi:MAG: hypothetical protein H0T46_09885 [Deltaproteobacteria bacterium]|nr:hypothetical protein [Deltaproteobacteria bacterium]